MSFTYNGNPSDSPLDYGRFIIGDTKDIGHILEDAEIEYLLNENTRDGKLNDLHFRAALFRQAATMYAINAVNRKLGPQTEDARDRLKYFQDEAEKAESRLTFSGTPPLPAYEYQKVFHKNMMANEEN